MYPWRYFIWINGKRKIRQHLYSLSLNQSDWPKRFFSLLHHAKCSQRTFTSARQQPDGHNTNPPYKLNSNPTSFNRQSDKEITWITSKRFISPFFQMMYRISEQVPTVMDDWLIDTVCRWQSPIEIETNSISRIPFIITPNNLVFISQEMGGIPFRNEFRSNYNMATICQPTVKQSRQSTNPMNRIMCANSLVSPPIRYFPPLKRSLLCVKRAYRISHQLLLFFFIRNKGKKKNENLGKREKGKRLMRNVENVFNDSLLYFRVRWHVVLHPFFKSFV